MSLLISYSGKHTNVVVASNTSNGVPEAVILRLNSINCEVFLKYQFD